MAFNIVLIQRVSNILKIRNKKAQQCWAIKYSKEKLLTLGYIKLPECINFKQVKSVDQH